MPRRQAEAMDIDAEREKITQEIQELERILYPGSTSVHFEQLLVTKWKHWEKALLRKSVVSDRLQRLLQPKLLKLEYLHEKQSRVSSELERQALEKQIKEAEKEIQDNPAYLLLKTRFLAIFSLPAFLATLPPNSIPTTLSPDVAVVSESDSEDLGDLELKDRARQLDCMACRVQASPAAPDPVQSHLVSPGQRAPSPGEVSAPSPLDASDGLDDLNVLRTRRARHSRR